MAEHGGTGLRIGWTDAEPEAAGGECAAEEELPAV
jgi:hypothetical protein